jgi:hypothetical protein
MQGDPITIFKIYPALATNSFATAKIRLDRGEYGPVREGTEKFQEL